MSKRRQRQELEIPIEGLEDFPLKILGLSIESIEKSKGHIKIPIELLPYLKIVRTPKHIREQRAKYKRDYELRLDMKKRRKSTKRGGVK